MRAVGTLQREGCLQLRGAPCPGVSPGCAPVQGGGWGPQLHSDSSLSAVMTGSESSQAPGLGAELVRGDLMRAGGRRCLWLFVAAALASACLDCSGVCTGPLAGLILLPPSAPTSAPCCVPQLSPQSPSTGSYSATHVHHAGADRTGASRCCFPPAQGVRLHPLETGNHGGATCAAFPHLGSGKKAARAENAPLRGRWSKAGAVGCSQEVPPPCPCSGCAGCRRGLLQALRGLSKVGRVQVRGLEAEPHARGPGCNLAPSVL